MNASTLVQKLWNYCNVLRDDGMSYGGYIEQLIHRIKRRCKRNEMPKILTSHWFYSIFAFREIRILQIPTLHHAPDR